MNHTLPIAALMLAACSGTPADNNSVGAEDERPNASLIEQDDRQVNEEAMRGLRAKSPQEFADAASASDQFEIQSSQKALAKAEGAAITEYARMMIAEHGQSSADLKAASGTIVPAGVLEPGQRADLALLDRTNGAAFDKAYVEQQLSGHEKTLTLLRSYAQAGGDEKLRGFAAKTAPVVDGHLRKARELGGTLAASKSN